MSNPPFLPPKEKVKGKNLSFDYNAFISNKDEYLNGLSILHINVQSLRSKYTAVECLVNELDKLDLLCLSETWLTEFDCNCYNLTNYSHVPSVRQNRNGGTSIFIKK